MKGYTVEFVKNRYRVEKTGFFTYSVLCGTGTQHLFTSFSKYKCQHVADKLTGAFFDGASVEAYNYTKSLKTQLDRAERELNIIHKGLRTLGYTPEEAVTNFGLWMKELQLTKENLKLAHEKIACDDKYITALKQSLITFSNLINPDDGQPIQVATCNDIDESVSARANQFATRFKLGMKNEN